MSFVVDAVTDVIEWVAGTIGDIISFGGEEIMAPVATFTSDTLAALLDDPIRTIAVMVAMAAGHPEYIPLINGASTAADGGDLDDVLETIALAYVTQAIGGEVAQHTGPFVDEVIGEALSEGVKELAVSAITQGTVAATQAIIYGEDPLEAFARGGITAAVSAGLGKIGEQMGWEIEVTDPDTGETTTRAIPTVVQNMVGAALTAELTGQEITPEIMANALTRSLITTQLVREYIVTNPDVGDREIGYITAAFQRTAAVALSGGTGEEAAAQIMNVISAYGMEELGDVIKDSGIGDLVGDTLDKISGDYARLQEVREQLLDVGPPLVANYEEYIEKWDTLAALWNTVEGNRDEIANILEGADGPNKPGLDDPSNPGGFIVDDDLIDKLLQLDDEAKKAASEYDRLVTEEGYLDRIHELAPLIETDYALLQGYQDDLIEAQNNLQRDADRLDGKLTSVYASTEQYLVHAMDPGFHAGEYAYLNNLPDDVDPFTHFLLEGQYNGAYTSREQYDRAVGHVRNTVLTQLMWDGFGVGENSLGYNLRNSDFDTLLTVVSDAGYNTLSQWNELANDPALQEAVFNQWVEIIATDPSNTYHQTGQVLDEYDVAVLHLMGPEALHLGHWGIPVAGREATPMEALALEQFFRSRDLPDGVAPSAFKNIRIGEGVSYSDVVSGAAVPTYTSSGVEYAHPEEMYRWDPQAGWLIGRRVQSTDGMTVGYEWEDRNGNTDTHSYPVEGDADWPIFTGVSTIVELANGERHTGGLYVNAETLDTYHLIVVTRNAIQEGMAWDEVQEGLGWSDTFIDLAQKVFNWAESTDTEIPFPIHFVGEVDAQNILANALKAGGGMLDAFNGMATLFGIAPDGTALGKFAQQLQDVGAANNTEKYKKELGKLEAMMNAPSTLPVDEDGNVIGTWYERAFDKVKTIAGAAATHPSAFISEYIAVEALQELVPLAIGGLATLGAKGTAMAMGRILSTRMAARTGLTAAAITDITESYGGTASETYDRTLMVALKATNPRTGRLFTREEAEKYAMTLAVQTGTVAATLTAATMGLGGMALEKAILGDKGVATGFVASGIDELARRVANGGTIMLREGVTESLEEGLATAFRESHLHQINPSIDVSGEVAGASFMGFLVGGGVSGGAYGVSQTGDMYSNFVSAIDPTIGSALNKVRNAFETYHMILANDAQFAAEMGYEQYLEIQRAEATQEINNALDDLDIASDSTVRTNILSQANPDYVNQAEAIAAFTNANPDYNPTQDEINSYVQTSGQSELDANIDRYVDDRYVDVQEVIAAAAKQGVTLTEEQAQEYVGQGPAGHEADVFEQLELELGPGYTSEGEARAMFEALGYTPTDAEAASYVGDVAESTQEAAIGAYVDPRQVNSAEAGALFADQNFEPSDADLAEFVGQGGANFEANTNVAPYVDPRQVTTAEAEALFDGLGYDATDAQIAQFTGQGDANFASTQNTAVGAFVDPRMVTEAEARAALIAQGIPEPTAEQIAGLTGQGGAEFESTQTEFAFEYADPFVTTYDEAKQFFNDLGFTPTKEEIETYVGATSEAAQQEAIAAFVDPRYTDADEAREFLTALGYDPTDEEVARFTGQVNEEQQQEAVGEYVDPRLVDAEEVAAAYAALGLHHPTDADIQELVGQYMESALAGRAEEYFPTARYNSIMDILNNFSGVGELSEAEQEALDLVKADIIAAMGDLGLEVAAIDDAVNDLTDAVGAVANGEEDATGLYSYIDQAIADLKAAGLTNEEVKAAITDIVGNPATTDEEGNSVDATGIYAMLGNLGTSIDALNDISVEDVNNIVANAISGLETLSEEDVDSIVSDIVGTPATTDEEGNPVNATGIYATLEGLGNSINNLNELNTEEITKLVTEALGDLENIGADDVSTIVDEIIGNPATTDEEGNPVDATGIYATLEGFEDSINNLNDLSTEDVESIVSDALDELNDLSTEDVESIVSDALDELNDLSTEEVTQLVTDALTGLNDLSTEEVTQLVTDALGGLETLSSDDVTAVVNNIIGSPATTDEEGNPVDASGIYAFVSNLNDLSTDDVKTIVADAIGDLENLSESDVESVVENLVGTPATEDAEATGIYSLISNLNNISEEDVKTIVNDIVDDLNNLGTDDVESIVADAIGGLENISEEDVQDVVNDIVGAPASDDTDATGIYAIIDGLNNLSDDDVAAIVVDIVGQPATEDSPATGIYATISDLNNISEEEVTKLVTEAIGGLETISEDDVSTIVDGIIGSPATTDEEGNPVDATGIYGHVDNTTDEILAILGNPATDEEDATGVYGYIDDAVGSLGTDLSALAGNVGTPAEYDADGNVVTPATGIYKQVQDLMDQGLTNAEATAQLAVDFGVAVTDLTNLIDAQTGTITENVDEVAEDVEDISGLLGQPAIADNPLTEEDESADPTGLFGIIAGYETAGQERDEAIDSALEDLATQLGTTKTDILDQLNLGLDQIETLITDSQTAVEEKIGKGLEDLGVDLGEMETEIFEKMAEYEADGMDRDDALAQAISDVSDQLGQTETDILDALTSTKTDILAELGTTEADVLAALAETETTLSDKITDVETDLTEDIDAVSNLVGKPATEVTQTDIDFVIDLIAGQQVIDENQQDLLAQYDVTGDGQITLDDQTLLEQLFAGEQVYDQVANTSIYAPTGTYGAISDTQTGLTNQMDQNQDQTMDAITEMEQNIVTNVEDEALRAGGRQFLQQALQAPDAMGQQVTVKQPDPLNLRYFYDFNSIFANPQQAGMFPSPYAKGGQVDDTTDKLLNIIGGS